MPETRELHHRVRRAATACHLLLAGLWGCAVPDAFGGPIPVRNQHPAQLTVLRLEPVGVATVPDGTVRLDGALSYSSLFVSRAARGNDFVMDGEILRAGLRGRYGLADGVELHLEVPVAYTTGGFLDDFVEDWHDLFGLPNAGRESRPHDLWEVRAGYQGTVAYEMERQDLTLLDMPIGARWHFLHAKHDQPFDVALRAGIELPTGDEDEGYGNGGIDYGLGLVAGASAGPFRVTVHVEHTFVHTPARAKAAGVEYEDVTGGGVGVEAGLNTYLTAIAQLEVESTVLRQIEGVRLDPVQTMLWLGLRAQVQEDFAIDFSFGEDLSANGSPDFTVYLGFRLGL